MLLCYSNVIQRTHSIHCPISIVIEKCLTFSRHAFNQFFGVDGAGGTESQQANSRVRDRPSEIYSRQKRNKTDSTTVSEIMLIRSCWLHLSTEMGVG